MANTNLFATGDTVKWKNETGTILRNDSDFRYWVVEFESYTRIIHYEDLELVYRV